jgi:pyruvate ferredoxin oxidoreductase alpha subunit
MRSQIEGSQAVARAVALCRPEVISAYPISPQTHIVEALSDAVRSGELAPCEYVMVESEFSAMSAAIGASATGARAYTATASQGLLFMAEALYNASGLGLPIVMTVANRAIGAPINIWNDHTDAMSQRDCGWVQLYAESNQEALDLHIQAFRLAEELSVPVMVCMDGFILTHAFEPVDVPSQEQVDAFLPPYVPRQVLDADAPLTIGAMVGPEAYTEVRYLAHAMQVQALDLIPEIAAEFELSFGRRSGGLVHPYRSDDADTVVVALGSVIGTIQDVVDELRDSDVSVGALGIGCFRPWPADEIRQALANAKRVIVVEKAFAVGAGGIVGQNVRLSLSGLPVPVYDVVAGLGGRAITKHSLHSLVGDVLAGRIEPNRLTFLDLDQGLVERELRRQKCERQSGPHAENLLRDLGVVRAGAG